MDGNIDAAPFDLSTLCCEVRRLADLIESRTGVLAPEHVTIKQAAQITGLSTSHIRRAVLRGDLEASNKGSPAHPVYRIARTDLAQWMERGKTSGKTPPRSVLQELIDRHLPGQRRKK